ncbi:MAG: hypothetical protein AAFP79_00245 [Pseudomonadota bacterium]
MVHVLKMVVFFSFMGLGLWGFASFSDPWGWLAFVAAFLVGGTLSQLVFKRFATPEQIKADLESRLHND